MNLEANGKFDYRPIGRAILAHLDATDILFREIDELGIRANRRSLDAAHNTHAAASDETLTARSKARPTKTR